jgi:LIM domain kinase 1
VLLPENGSGIHSDYSTSVIRGRSQNASEAGPPPALSSVLTIRPTTEASAADTPPLLGINHQHEPTQASIATIQSYATAPSVLAPSTAAATEGGSTIRMSPSTLVHRFTLIKPGGAKRAAVASGGGGAASPPPGASAHYQQPTADGWSPFDFFFSSGMLAARCDLCAKRIGWKPVLQCDDCGLR